MWREKAVTEQARAELRNKEKEDQQELAALEAKSDSEGKNGQA